MPLSILDLLSTTAELNAKLIEDTENLLAFNKQCRSKYQGSKRKDSHKWAQNSSISLIHSSSGRLKIYVS